MNLQTAYDIYSSILNEGNVSKVTLSELIKLLVPFGWKHAHSSSGDGYKFMKDDVVVYFHLKHGNSLDANRKMDVNGLDCIREKIVKDFKEDGDPTLINSIDWSRWATGPSPFRRELKDYDPVSGKRKEVSNPEAEVLPIGQKLALARKQKAVALANEKYKDCRVFKIDPTDENSAYIIEKITDDGRGLEYNTCRSSEDRRPMVRKWTPKNCFQKNQGEYYFGFGDMRDISIRYHQVFHDGTIDKKERRDLRESKNISKKFKKIW